MRTTDGLERCTRRFRWPVVVAALLVIPAVALDATAGPRGPIAAWADALNWAIWLTFAAEYVVSLAVAPDRWHWFRSHPFDLVIVVVTPPFAPALVQGLRVGRLLRALRLLRLARTARVGHELFSGQGLQWAATVSALTVVGGGVAFTEVESGQHPSALDGLWWAVTTMTTIGYGDVTPRTTVGRILAVFVMIVGIGSVALLTGAIAERFVRAASPPSANDPPTLTQLALIHAQLVMIAERLSAIEAGRPERPTPG